MIQASLDSGEETHVKNQVLSVKDVIGGKNELIRIK